MLLELGVKQHCREPGTIEGLSSRSCSHKEAWSLPETISKQRWGEMAWLLSSLCLPDVYRCLFYFSDFIYLFSERGEGRERNINVWLPLVRPLLETLSTTWACAPTGNGTSNALFRRPALNPLIHTSWGYRCLLLATPD